MNTTKYLPFGYIPQTEEQLKEQDRKFRLYEMYGIPYGMLDSSKSYELEDSIVVTEDRAKARLLIMQGLEIPEELKNRLLKYKQQELKLKSKNVE